ncbi:hypothetical protein E2C01_079925 [Portunus trituberculatus]|uniref:Uncharacterized protein n=1 Tax=Portunus trituberculatus TaxID=210409 RepID=A0A5B7IMR8_PORTR|nr:hypothetical protein [Portunus trituberculatus]
MVIYTLDNGEILNRVSQAYDANLIIQTSHDPLPECRPSVHPPPRGPPAGVPTDAHLVREGKVGGRAEDGR